MRTTVVLDDELLARARHHAVDAGTTLSEWLNAAMRLALAQEQRAGAAGPFVMPTFGPSGAQVDHAPADFAAANEEDDAGWAGQR